MPVAASLASNQLNSNQQFMMRPPRAKKLLRAKKASIARLFGGEGKLEGVHGHRMSSTSGNMSTEGASGDATEHKMSSKSSSMKKESFTRADDSTAGLVDSLIVDRQPMEEEEAYENDDSMDIDTSSELGFNSDEEDGMSHNFDMKLLCESIEKGKATLDQVKDMDVVLVVGKTGTGKSTLIQGIAGKKIVKTVHETTKFGETVSKDVYEAENALPGFEIGHVKTSKTKFINCYVRNQVDGMGGVAYVDSPGFEDTDGYEVDVATSVMLSQVAKNCRSMRFVILINYASLLEDRGMAMRSVLKLTRNFVEDFDDEKQSFLFLFTHSDEIKEVPDSLDAAKKCLKKEIIRTAEGTRDRDVRRILHFMRTSLQENKPFVDILHPLKTDFSRLDNFVESKLKPVKKLFLAGNCGLTTSSQLKLSGEIQKRLQHLVRLLESESSNENIEMVKETMNTFFCFGRYIDFEDVRKAVSESKALFEEHIRSHHEVIDCEIRRGTSETEEFNAANVTLLKSTMSQLFALKDACPGHSTNCETILPRIRNAVNTLQEKIHLENEKKFDSLNKILQKLQTWSCGFEELVFAYESACSHVAGYISKVSNDCGAFDSSELAAASKEQISLHIQNLGVLKSICDNSEHFAAHNLDVEVASKTLQSSSDSMKHELKSWVSGSSSALKENQIEEGILQTIAAKVHSVEMLSGLFQEAHTCDELTQVVASAMKDLESSVVEHFAEVSFSMRSDESLDFNPCFEKTLRNVRDASQLFDGLRGSRWKGMRSECCAVIERVKMILSTKCGELDEMSQSTLKHGFRNGEREGRALEFLSDCEWFDGILDPCARFIANSCIKIKKRYRDRANQVNQDAAAQISTLYSDSHQSTDAIVHLKGALQELHQISNFASVSGKDIELLDSATNVRSKLREYVDSIAERTTASLSEWKSQIQTSGAENKLYMITKDLNKTLREVEVLRTADEECDSTLDTIQAEIHDVFSDFSSKIQNTMKRERDYHAKAESLAIVDSLGEFSRLGQLHLPNFDKLKEEARLLVQKDAATIETMVSETSEWDEIDKLLEEFESATALDQFTSNEASSRLRPLRQLREQKELQVDDLVDSLIVKQDFNRIHEFLVPLANSKDQLKKQKFDSYRSKIRSSLNGTIDDLHRLLSRRTALTEATIQSIVGGLEILQQAQDSLGKHFSGGELDLALEIERLEKRLNEVLDMILTQMGEATQKADFVQLGRNKKLAQLFSRLADSYLRPATRNRLKTAISEYEKAVKSAPAYLEEYFKSHFQDGTQLPSIMCGLKAAFESDNPDLDEFSDLYQDMRKKLVERINETIQVVIDVVSEHHCFDEGIEVFHKLDRHLQQGWLHDHLKSSDLRFNCRTELDNLRLEKQEHGRKMEFDGFDARSKLEQWAIELDRLHPTSGVFHATYSRWRTGTTYGELCKRLERKVSSRFAQGKAALHSRDHLVVNECLVVLDLIRVKVGKHIQLALSLLEDLETRTMNSFLDLCEQAQDALGSWSSRSEFELRFADFRNFVIHVPFITNSDDGKKAYSMMNQHIFKSIDDEVSQLESMVNSSFDFHRIKSKVEHVRAFGGFVADQCTLFHEEIRCCEHVEVDKWLENIWALCCKYFTSGRDLSRIKHYAVLGVPPSATKSEIKRAYKEKAKIWHPDKRGTGEGDEGAMFRKFKEAWDELEDSDAPTKSGSSKPFDDLLRGIGKALREKVREYLSEQQYGSVEKILFRLREMRVLDDLVDPRMDSGETTESIAELVKHHVEKVKVEVDSNWAERNYKALNDNISDLRLMEANFKSYPQIFPVSWNNGIIESIKKQIEDLGNRARRYLNDKTVARENDDDFKRCFYEMGFVLVELPLLKGFTKAIMCSVLESCLHANWGYSYLFEFGLSLQRGDENAGEDERRVGQVLVAEFSHFKEVLTMVWNEETCQKPVEDTVQDMRGEHRTASSTETLNIDANKLVDSFTAFEAEYKSLLGEFIQPDADLNALVAKTTRTANKLKPICCSSGWSPIVKRQLPNILAGVFAVFTILKSGESYNRINAAAGDTNMGQKLLMKPHNIQVLTLLRMLGCDDPSSGALCSQLMQIRTGEGKSMILGAAAVLLGLLGFRVRCVCYSEYLSNRDNELFKDVFRYFQLTDRIKYSKITTLSEDTTAAKGNIRRLTESLLLGQMKGKATLPGLAVERVHSSHSSNDYGNASMKANTGVRVGSFFKLMMPSATHGTTAANKELPNKREAKGKHRGKEQAHTNETKEEHQAITRAISQQEDIAPKVCQEEEILLVDEVDVFFGAEFYGQTYNQVAQLREPEVAEILKTIWTTNKRDGRKQRLADIKAMSAYTRLLQKIPHYEFLLDNEILLMIDQVKRVDDEPYHLDSGSDRIGYKVMDTISYEATYGYRTIFAYLKEADKGTLKDPDATLANVLAMPVSCGQFSYANISPTRILGVSGTLQVMGTYEKDVMAKYGIETFVYVPSVYGKSNFDFDKAGEGISIEPNMSDFFQKITNEIQVATRQKRAVIVFFRDNVRMNQYTSSAFYRRLLGRNKKLLTENMSTTDKEFVINRAATSGQITICTSIFGRGTDFFCKDDRVQVNGGVHIIQAFLSCEPSEEVQIQGRTARQGKKGSYQMVLLESDLVEQFEIQQGEMEKIAKVDRYEWLCRARDKYHNKRCLTIEESLVDATEKDKRTHKYFDALLRADRRRAHEGFKDLYLAMKKRPVPSTFDLDLAFVIDVTGSMAPYSRAITKTIKSLLEGRSSIVGKLKTKFPETAFKLRFAVMGFRDIDDGCNQFTESLWHGSHFTDSIRDVAAFIDSATAGSSGGGDLAEDHLGAISRCASWNNMGDWTSQIKFMMLLTDAPAHGLVPAASAGIANADSYPTHHPDGLTLKTSVETLISKDIDLFICSFNSAATSRTEKELSQQYLQHPDNKEQREVISIPMFSTQHQFGGSELLGGYGRHIIFVLDESGSMSDDWAGVVVAYNEYLLRRRQNQSESDLVSVVQFDSTSRITVRQNALSTAPEDLDYRGGGTTFSPAVCDACTLARETPESHVPVVVFMSDGNTSQSDADEAANMFSTLNNEVRKETERDLELHVIAFGSGVSTTQLKCIACTTGNGMVHTSSDTAHLSNVFVDIASSQDVTTLLEAEIAKRISEAVSDKLSLEFIGQ